MLSDRWAGDARGPVRPLLSAFRKVRRQLLFTVLACGAAFTAVSILQTPADVRAPAEVSTPADFNVPARAPRPAALPISVHDGDTIRIGDERIRLLGFDTPELGRHSRCAREAREAERARDFLRRSIDRARDIRIERDGTDRYGRTLARLYIDGTDAASLMIGSGYARAYWGGRRDGWC
ncbi:thermonuclease family protein [Parvibaculum sp.]|uniref:thermonuclease family protein n=1 Tax=Parvibaculum sp. TaxID=2024848 RepID=UPI00261F32F0|nr:thermonuclease family protein [Parvibaculum sp.]MCW5728217.1 thermonuclease family protein [Parvibaculum sp.]